MPFNCFQAVLMRIDILGDLRLECLRIFPVNIFVSERLLIATDEPEAHFHIMTVDVKFMTQNFHLVTTCEYNLFVDL